MFTVTIVDLTLSELVAAANTRLAGVAATDGRVADAIDERLVRYYQSAGLVDRPLRYDGRAAVYGRRHLLQLLAVRRLQAAGHSLAQVQRTLAGVADAALERAVGEAPAPAPAPTWVAAELAPGVVVTVDPRIVADPAAVLSVLSRSLNPRGEQP